MRIGVLTGGGDCPGLNAVIRAVVKTSAHQYNWEVLGVRDGFYGLVMNKINPLTINDVSGILPRGGTILGSSNRDNPFKFRKVISGETQYVDASKECIANIKKHEIEVLIVIGGDGTQAIADKFYKMGVNIVGIPKTIDNDLPATDVTFGFDTALNTAMGSIDKIHTTAESHHRVMIVEVMGRDAGWIGVSSGMASGAHIILIPEIPYDIEKIVEKIFERRSQGKHFSIVVVSEGAASINGKQVVHQIVEEDQTQPIRLGGIGEYIRNELESLTHFEVRVTVLGHIQRGGTPSAFDRILATRYGAEAVELINKKKFGYMVCLRAPEIEAVPLKEATGTINKVPIDGGLIRAAKLIGISFGD